MPMAMENEGDHDLIFSDYEAESDELSVTGMTIFFQDAINGAVTAVDVNAEGTAQDLVTAVEAVTGAPTALSFAGKRLDNMHAALSELEICADSVVQTVPKIIKVELQLIQLKPGHEGIISTYHVPMEELMFEVPYFGDLCPISQLVDYLRDSLISKVQLGHWDQTWKKERGYQKCHSHSFQQHIDNLVKDGDKDLIDIYPLRDYEMYHMERDHLQWNHAEKHLEYLQQHHIDIEWEQLMEMSAKFHSNSLVRDKYPTRVYFQVLD